MMRTRPVRPFEFARTSRQWRETNPFSAFTRAVSRMKGRGNVHANRPVAMRNSGPINGAGSETSPASHHFDLLAARSVGRVARITRVHGARGLELAEKSELGWARRRRRAFTRVELCACLAAGALLALLALPALATSQSRGHVAQCLNNLRQMGRAVHVWAGDYQNQPPWRTPVQDGGLLQESGAQRPGNVWFDLLSMSNQLVTPRILACPGDAGVLVATDFTFNAPGGYASPAFRNLATSYILNLESFAEYPGGLLFGDRNAQFAAGANNCSARVNNAVGFYLPSAANQGWTNAVHGLSGNIVVMDGSVSETSNDQLRAAMAKSRDDNGQYVHLLRPTR
jgi:hypothetical protein